MYGAWCAMQGQRELAKRLEQIAMDAGESTLYDTYFERVKREIAQLRLIFEQLDAKQHERTWQRDQLQGDLDDTKLIDAIAGAKRVYRQRGVPTPQLGLPPKLPKRLCFVVDVSGSMYRFNGHDKRLERMVETVLLVMEALAGFEHKYCYTIVGHSGDGPSIPFVHFDQPPQSRRERLQVLQKMFAHSQYCTSGDNTVEAIHAGVSSLLVAEADDYFLFAVSDANLRRYGITPVMLKKALTSVDTVNAHCLFIASLDDEADTTAQSLPGHALVCRETSQMPQLFKQIFTSSSLLN
jgi:hypothetical protein